METKDKIQSPPGLPRWHKWLWKGGTGPTLMLMINHTELVQPYIDTKLWSLSSIQLRKQCNRLWSEILPKNRAHLTRTSPSVKSDKLPGEALPTNFVFPPRVRWSCRRRSGPHGSRHMTDIAIRLRLHFQLSPRRKMERCARDFNTHRFIRLKKKTRPIMPCNWIIALNKKSHFVEEIYGVAHLTRRVKQ